MGNSSLSQLPSYSCYDENISRSTVTPEYWDSHSISESFKGSTIFTAASLLLFMLIGLPGNALILASIIKKRLYKKSTTHVLLLNSVISDLLVCLLVMPLGVVAGFSGGFVFGESDYTRCHVCQTGLIFTALTVHSVNIISLISVDRFIFFKFHLRYENWISMPRVIVGITVTWLLSIFQSILPLFGFGEIKYAYPYGICVVNLYGRGKLINNLFYGVFLLLLALPAIITTVVTNLWIAVIARKQIREVYQTGNEGDDNNGLRKSIQKQRNKKQMALMRTFGAILISNIVVWTPISILIVISLFVNGRLIPLGLYVVVYVTFISHTVVHPLVEGCFLPEIKSSFRNVLEWCRCIRRQQRSDMPSTTASDVLN